MFLYYMTTNYFAWPIPENGYMWLCVYVYMYCFVVTNFTATGNPVKQNANIFVYINIHI